jgi:CTD kinase subunit beta
MLESSSFDFRNRHPQHLLVKIAKFYGLSKSSPIVRTAYTICLDVYRTFAPIKQCTATLAFACLELSGRLLKEVEHYPGLQDLVKGRDYDRWNISRVEVMETLLDLLDLYTHYRTSTAVGPDFNLDTFLEVKIPLNDELNNKNLPRFTEYVAPAQLDKRADTGSYAATVNGVSAAAAAANGVGKSDPSPISPSTAPGSRQNGVRQKAGERGREGTVRFMLNPDREQQERAVVAEYTVAVPGPGGRINNPTTDGGKQRRQP